MVEYSTTESLKYEKREGIGGGLTVAGDGAAVPGATLNDIKIHCFDTGARGELRDIERAHVNADARSTDQAFRAFLAKWADNRIAQQYFTPMIARIMLRSYLADAPLTDARQEALTYYAEALYRIKNSDARLMYNYLELLKPTWEATKIKHYAKSTLDFIAEADRIRATSPDPNYLEGARKVDVPNAKLTNALANAKLESATRIHLEQTARALLAQM